VVCDTEVQNTLFLDKPRLDTDSLCEPFLVGTRLIFVGSYSTTPSPFTDNPLRYTDPTGLDSILDGAQSYYGDGYDSSGYSYSITANERLPGNGDTGAVATLGGDAGHAFVTLEKDNGFSGEKTTTTAGFYGVSPLNGVMWGKTFEGAVKDDSKTRVDGSATMALSKDAYESAASYLGEIKGYADKGDTSYNLYTYNCVDFVRGVFSAAGISVPECGVVGPYLSNPNSLHSYFEGLKKEGCAQ
jgi:hypothetical protein